MAKITMTGGGAGGGGSISGTATRVAFFGGTPGNPSTTLDDSANLEWDDTTSRLSVGDAATVGSSVTIAGTTASDATGALEVRTSSAFGDLLLFKVYDNGRIDSRMLSSTEALTDNTAIGVDAGSSVTTGVNNTFIGYEAGKLATAGNSNTMIGFGSGAAMITADSNTSVGSSSCASLTYGGSNTAVGVGSLYSLSGSQLSDSASYNTAVGVNAGRYRGSGSLTNANSKYGIYLGYSPRANDTGGTENETVIGNSLVGNGSNTVTIGNSAITDTYLRGNMHLEGSPVIYFDTATGTKIGSDSTEKLAFWNKTPIVQPTTAISGAAIVHGTGTTIKADDTFGGYTLAQIAQALINVGILQ
jgi:hypothetical protein